ncbi:hypothetical protein AX17_007500 [Amanita inopinata Kibby_2008]|nr:hypothetical protein AX17_007500 [Amanita inopinata Kibby_2008]
MFFDLNVPIPQSLYPATPAPSKKGKSKQQNSTSNPSTTHSYGPSQISALELRIDLLVHLGYSVLAFTQTVHKKVDAKTHVNILDPLIPLLQKRPGILYLKRLNIILDEDSEKGFGLINANTSLFSTYDILSLTPTTSDSFSLACLTHTVPSPLTAHIISLPLTLPRLNFYLKHTLIRTALKNGATFEINYVGALGGENEHVLSEAGYAEAGQVAKRNWWASAREVVRVTKGKGVVVSGGAVNDADLRAPRDVANLITLLDIPQDAAHDTLSKTPKSLTLRAQTRRTYRAVLSEPTVVVPEGSMNLICSSPPPQPQPPSLPVTESVPLSDTIEDVAMSLEPESRIEESVEAKSQSQLSAKRPREVFSPQEVSQEQGQLRTISGQVKPLEGFSKKKKRKKNNKPLESLVGS